MKPYKTYKTPDNKLWYCIGLQKRTPVVVDYTGKPYRIIGRYKQSAVETSWEEWLEAHKYFWLNCVVFGTIEKYQQSVNKILNGTFNPESE